MINKYYLAAGLCLISEAVFSYDRSRLGGGMLPPTIDYKVSSKNSQLGNMVTGTTNTTVLPESVDLSGYAVPTADQAGLRESCATVSTAYHLMGWYANRYNKSSYSIFAPGYIFSFITPETRTFQTNFALLSNIGVTPNNFYSSMNTATLPQPLRVRTAKDDANAAFHKINSSNIRYSNTQLVGAPTTKDIIKNELAQGTPVIISVKLREQFFKIYATNSYPVVDISSPYTHPGGNPKVFDYHALLVLGYNSNGLLVQNSWGSNNLTPSRGWGRNGFGYLSWAVVDSDVIEAHTINYTPSSQKIDAKFIPSMVNFIN